MARCPHPHGTAGSFVTRAIGAAKSVAAARPRLTCFLFSNQLPLLPFPRGSQALVGTGKIGAHRAPMLSVVVPCYNERDGVAELHRRVSAACLEQSLSYEVVLVIDGATDGTRETIFE